jgi:hypothetical protein
MQLHPFLGLGRAAPPRRRARRLDRGIRSAHRLDRDRLDDQAAIGHEEAVAPAVGRLELGDDIRDPAEADDERRVGSVVAHVNAPDDSNPLRRDALGQQLFARDRSETPQFFLQAREPVLVQLRLDRLFAHRDRVGEPHAVGGEHAGKRVNEDAGHSEGVGDPAGVLTRGAPEAAQRIFGDVVPALNGDLLDRFGHVADRDLEKALGHLLGAACIAGRAANLPGKTRESSAHRGIIEGHPAVRTEHGRKEFRLDPSEHHVRVGHGQRAVSAVARWTRIRSRRIGPDPVARAVEMQDRSAARGHGMDAHHRRAHAHPRDQRLESTLQLARIVRDVGRGPAHVEPDDFFEARGERRPHRADDTARRPGENAVLARKPPRVRKAPVRLHEHQAYTLKLGGHLSDIALQNGREVGIDDRRIPA